MSVQYQERRCPQNAKNSEKSYKYSIDELESSYDGCRHFKFVAWEDVGFISSSVV